MVVFFFRNARYQDNSKNHFKESEKSKSAATRVPNVNLQSWNERPKRQISIKTDRDYVFGKAKEESFFVEKPKNTNIVNGHEIKAEVDNRVKISVNYESDSSDNLSRVPVVRAVAFKKPLVQNCVNGTTTPCRNAFVDGAPVTIMNGNHSEDTSSKISKSRPASFYLYGERVPSVNPNCEGISSKDSLVSNGCVRVSQNDFRSNQFGGGCNGGSCNRNTTDENNVKRKNPLFGSNQVDSVPGKRENFTFKTYKMKLMENEKAFSSSNGRCSDLDYQQRLNLGENNFTCNGKTVVNINLQTNGDVTGGKFPKFGRTYDRHEESVSRCNGAQPSVIAVSSAAAPVPPPAPPPLKGAPVVSSVRSGVNRKTNWSKANINDNPRDVLLSSIKNFNRENLRKLRVK